MAEVGGKPFIYYLIVELRRQGFDDVVMCIGYRGSQISDYFGSGKDLGVRIRYSLENEPLGTAGALKLAEPLLESEKFLLANGDSFLGGDYARLFDLTDTGHRTGVIALHRTADSGRYGTVELATDNRITSFVEKSAAPTRRSALINAGVYAFDRSVLAEIPSAVPASLERDVLPKLVREGRLYGFELKGAFIDIGVPEDYRRLEKTWRQLFGGLAAK